MTYYHLLPMCNYCTYSNGYMVYIRTLATKLFDISMSMNHLWYMEHHDVHVRGYPYWLIAIRYWLLANLQKERYPFLAL